MKKINRLVFGGNVFVGRAVANRLMQEGYQVYVLNRGNYPNPEGVIHLKVDRNNREEMTRILAGLYFDVVFDITAYFPEQTLLAVECLEEKTKHFIHISSATVYMRTEEYPITEESSVGSSPVWGDYGANKFGCEQELVKSYVKKRFPITIFRPFYIYGPGNNHSREVYVFRRLLQGKPIILPGNGRPIIQFGHIDDLVEALLVCILQKQSYGQVYNIAENRFVTLKGWIEACAEAIGVEAQIVLIEASDYGYKPRDWFPFRDIHLFGNCDKVMLQLNIEAKFHLVEGLRDTYHKLNQDELRRPIEYNEAENAILAKIAGK